MQYLSVRITPNADKTELKTVMADGTQKINVAAPADSGKANKVLIRFFKKELKQDIEIVSGETGRRKLLRIIGEEK